MKNMNTEPEAPGQRARRMATMLRSARSWAILALAGAIALPAANAGAQSYQTAGASSYYVSAPVVSVSPITTERTVNHPVRQCTRDPRHMDHHYESRRPQQNLFLPGLFGGIVGGLIGNQFGGGSGKKALTIAGALAGSSIARESARQNRRDSYPREVCHTAYETEVVRDISAYDVTYEYAGQLFDKRMSQHPGNSVRVRVALAPVVGET